jgi:hypothetical protein
MENQTRFDLNAAIESWRQELAGQPNFASDDRRELETHLRDAIAELSRGGLNEDDSFWLARHRVGQPEQLAKEFVKADPAAVWRERVFWMLLAIFLSSTLGRLAGSIGFALTPVNANYMVEIVPATTLIVLGSLIPIIIAVSLAKGKWVALFSRLAQLVGNRRHLAAAAFLCVVLSSSIRMAAMAIFYSRHEIHNSTSISPILQGLVATIYPLIIALVLICLMPSQKQKTPKRA